MKKQGEGQFHFLKVLVLAVTFAIIARFLVIGVYKVPTSAMLPSLHMGDIAVGWKFPYHSFTRPIYKFLVGENIRLQRGDLIVFKHPDGKSSYVKLILGLPGDKIQFTSRNQLVVNSESFQYELLDEQLNFTGGEYYNLFKESSKDYSAEIIIRRSDSESQVLPEEMIVPLGSYYVLGDNRDASDDSRDWGVIPEENIEARLDWIVLSLNWRDEDKSVFRKSRFLLPIESN